MAFLTKLLLILGSLLLAAGFVSAAGVQPISFDSKVVLSPGEATDISLTLKNFDSIPRNVELSIEDLPSGWDFEALKFTLASGERKKASFTLTPSASLEFSEYALDLIITYNGSENTLPLVFVFDRESKPVGLSASLSDEGSYYLIVARVSNDSNYDLSDLKVDVDVPFDWRLTFSPSKELDLEARDSEVVEIKLYPGSVSKSSFKVTVSSDDFEVSDSVSLSSGASQGVSGLFLAGSDLGFTNSLLMIGFFVLLAWTFSRRRSNGNGIRRRRDRSVDRVFDSVESL